MSKLNELGPERPSANKAGGEHLHRFQTVKTLSTVFFRERWQLTWLLSLSLDDQITEISQPELHGHIGKHELAIGIKSSDGRSSMRFCSIKSTTALQGLAGRCQADIDIKSEIFTPILRSNTLAVWACRSYSPCFLDQVTIDELLDKYDEISIRELTDKLRREVHEVSRIVLSLAFACVLKIDMNTPISIDTTVSKTQFWRQHALGAAKSLDQPQ